MPEGDTVWLAAHTLDAGLAGRTITSSDFRVPALATASVTGATLLEVVPRGKHILMRFDDGRSLHSHLRMDGSWHIYDGDAEWRGGPEHRIRAVLRAGERVAVGYRVHDLRLLSTTDEGDAVGHLGPDLLDPDVDLDQAVANLLREPTREIGPALLDQRNLAGIGNLYKAETLFLQRTSPWRPVGEVGDLQALVSRARTLLDVNKVRFDQITTGDPRPGFTHWVFERARQRCRRCGTSIRVADQGEPPYQRLTYRCSTCQR